MSERARQGRTFGPAAGDYQRGRPGYPAAALDLAGTGLGLDPAAAVLDLAAGTGKLTRLLADRYARVVAVEPLAAMRQALAADLPAVPVCAGTAERLPLAGGAVRAVFVAEAFHWFDGPAALAETARVLDPPDPAAEPGGIVLLWNTASGGWDPPVPEPARTLVRAAVARGGEPGGALLARGQWREAFPGSRFGPLQHGQVGHDWVQDRDGVIAHAMSISSVAGLPDGERAELRTRLRELVPPGQYRRPLRTDVYWARLVAASRRSASGAGGQAATSGSIARWCDRCGGERADGDHAACAAARALEPPRFCPQCRRRMRVQVLPAGWSATCVAHGELRQTGPPWPPPPPRS